MNQTRRNLWASATFILTVLTTVMPCTAAGNPFSMFDAYLQVASGGQTNWYTPDQLPDVFSVNDVRLLFTDVKTWPGWGASNAADTVQFRYRLNSGSTKTINLPFLENVGESDKWGSNISITPLAPGDKLTFYYRGYSDGATYNPTNDFGDWSNTVVYGTWTVRVSQASIPSIAIQSAGQRSDGTGRVDVNYSLTVPYNGTAPITVTFSSNGGATWNITPQGGSLSGDYGSGISSGARSLQWNAAAQLAANTYNNNFRARLVTTAVGATITNVSPPFTIDLRGLQGGLTVAGKVRNAATGQGLSGVSVSLAGQNTTTAGDGSYSFSNVILANGSTITASKSGYATHSSTIPAPAGGIQSVPKDISLSSASGNKPVVTGVRAKHDGLFLSGASLANEYTASIDWRGQTPSKVHFYWGRNSPQHTAVNTASDQATAAINMALGFQGSFTLGDNKLTVQAEDSTGQLSDAFIQNVAIIPMPLFLVDQGLMLPFTLIPGNHPKLSWEFNVPRSFMTASDVRQIPFIGSIGPDLNFDLAFDYDLVSGEWGIFAGRTWDERAVGRRGRRPNAPKFFLGNVDVDFAFGGKAKGVASQTRGVVLERIGVEMDAGVRLEILAVYFSDYVPGGQIIRILDLLKGVGIDINSIQKVTVYGTLNASLDAMFKFPTLEFDTANATLKPGIEAIYEPNLGVVQGEIGVGGAVAVKTEIAPTFGIDEITGEVYMKIKFVVFGMKQMDEKFLILNGTIYERSPQGLMRAMSSANGEPIPGYDGWTVYQAKVGSSPTIERDYLNTGGEGFALASAPVHAKSVLSANGSMLSPLEAFRLMKQSPVAKVGIALSSKGGANPPQLAQAELPIITNAFPYSEPTLAGYGQELMLLWVADNANSNDLQYADIRWSRFDGTDWSAPTSIVTDTRADFAPKVAFDGNGDAVAVWQKVNDPNFTNANLSAMAAEMEIVWSRWDRASGIWSAPSALTTNTYYDGSPFLAGPLTDGDLLVTWTKNEANLLMGTGWVGAVENDVVLCSRWSTAAHAWTAPEVVVSNLAYRLSQSFAGISNRAIYAWTTDADGVLTNDTDQEIYAKVWSNGVWGVIKRCTSNSVPDKTVRCAVSPQGAIHLVWQSASNLVSSVDLTTNARLVRVDSSSAGFADYAMTYGPQGNMVLLWQEMTTSGSDAHYSVYDPNSDTWSKDATFFNDSPLERSFSPVWDSSGQLNFAYNKVEIIITNETVELEGGGSVTVSNVPQQGRVDVAVAVRRLITDVAILPGGFTVEGANYLPGDALTLSAMLRNVGDVAVSNAAVSFYEGNPASGGVLITNLAWSGWLEGAATNAILSTVWVVPEPATNRTLYAVANPVQAFTEFTGNNNTQAVNIGGVDLSVSMVAATAETNGSMRVIAQVQNIGAPGATNTTLALRRQGQSGGPLATVDVPALEPGLLAQVALDLPEGTQPEGEAFYTLNADETGVVPDIDTINNAASFAMNLWLDSDRDGIPDWWENRYYGGSTAADAAALAANGVNTLLQAFIAGLDPQDPAAFLLVEGSDPETGGFMLTWGSVSNKFYRISRASDLVNGQGFSPIESHILATPPVNTYQDTSAATNAGPFFYRIEVE